MKFFDSPNLIREATATTQLAILSELLCILGAEVDYFDSSPDELAVGSSPDELAVDVQYARVDYATFCTFLSEAFENIPDEHRYPLELHEALDSF